MGDGVIRDMNNRITDRAAPWLPDWAIDFIAGFILILPFVVVTLVLNDFKGMRLYGATPEWYSWIQIISPKEFLYYLSQLLIVPSVICFARMIYRLTEKAGFDRIRRAAAYLMAQPSWKLAVGWYILGYALIWASVVWIIQFTPLTDDEYVYEFQAKILAQFSIRADSPPLRQFYDNIFLVNDGRMYGQYAMGNSLIQAIGVILLGTVYSAPPVIGGYLLVLIFLAGEASYNRKCGMIAAALAATSPFYLHSVATLHSHPPATLLLGCCWLMLVYSLRWPKAWLAGLAAWFGACALGTRWVSTAVVGYPVVYYVWYRWVKDWQTRKNQIYAFAAVGVACLVYGIIIYYVITGRLLSSTYEVLWSDLGYGKGGFGKYPWGMEHTLFNGIVNVANAFFRLNFWLLGWPVTMALALYVYVPWRQKRSVYDYLFLASIISLGIMNVFYYWPGVSDTGPVTYFGLFPIYMWLTARGILRLRDRLEKPMGSGAATRFTAICVCMFVLAAVPAFHRVQIRETRALVDRINEPYEKAEEEAQKPALVFMDYYLNPVVKIAGSWVAGRRNNSPDLNDEILYVRHISDEEDRLLIESMPERHAYRLWYDFEGELNFEPVETVNDKAGDADGENSAADRAAVEKHEPGTEE